MSKRAENLISKIANKSAKDSKAGRETEGDEIIAQCLADHSFAGGFAWGDLSGDCYKAADMAGIPKAEIDETADAMVDAREGEGEAEKIGEPKDILWWLLGTLAAEEEGRLWAREAQKTRTGVV